MVREIIQASLSAVLGGLPLLIGLLAAVTAAFALERLVQRRTGGTRRLWVHPAALAIAIAAGLWLAWKVVFLCDDAFISFRYADNLAEGRGLVWNIGERVEGYTNFLWTVMLAGASWLGLDTPKAALFGCLLSFVLALLAVASTVRRLSPHPPALPFAAIVLAGAQPFTTFATSGLETMPGAALIVAALWASSFSPARRGALLAGLALTGATLMRPDHVLFYGCFGLAMVAEDLIHRPERPLRRRLDLRRYLVYAAPFLLIYVPYFLIRWRAYGDLFPNTYYAKSGGLAHWPQGYVYAAHFVGSSGAWAWAPAALLALLGKPRAPDETRARIFALLAAPVFTAYIMKVGGDFMEYRFFVPLLPVIAVAVEVSLRWRLEQAQARWWRWLSTAAVAVGAAAALLPVRLIQPKEIRWGMAMEPSFYRVSSVFPLEIDSIHFTNGRLLREELTDRGIAPPLAASAIGLLGYYSRLPVVDVFGLTNRAIAHKETHRRGRPGHEKLATLEEMIQEGAILDFTHKWGAAFAGMTQVQVDDLRLHFIRLDPAWASAIRRLPRARVPDPERDVERLACSAPREQILAASRFYARFLEVHPARDKVLARLAQCLGSIADFEAEATEPGATLTGDGLRLVQGARPSGASGRGWLTSLPDEGGAVGRLQIPLAPLHADELRFALGGPASERLRVQLLVDGAVVRTASPTGSRGLTPVSWRIDDLRGQSALLLVEDADPAPGAGLLVDAIHVPAENDVRQKIAAFDPAIHPTLGDLIQEAELLLPPGDPDRERLQPHIGARWSLDVLPEGATITGEAFGAGPVPGALTGQGPIGGVEGEGLLNSFHQGDPSTGRVELPEIELPSKPIVVLVGGGDDCQKTYVGLEVEGQIVTRACGQSDEILRPMPLRAPAHAGKRARLVVVDEATGPWGHLLADDVIIPTRAPASLRPRPRSVLHFNAAPRR